MRRINVLLCLLVICLATAVHAQPPKPNPELKKLQAYLGHWTVEGEVKQGPQGPGTKFKGTYDGQMTLGGFFFQGQMRDSKGVLQGIDYFGYDAATKNFVVDSHLVEGVRISQVGSVSGNTFSWTGKASTPTGEQISIRERDAFTPDFTSFTITVESSPDGKTWVHVFEGKYTKASAAPEK